MCVLDERSKLLQLPVVQKGRLLHIASVMDAALSAHRPHACLLFIASLNVQP